MKTFAVNEGLMSVYPVREDILRIVYTKHENIGDPTALIEENVRGEIDCEYAEDDKTVIVNTARVRAIVDKKTGAVCFANAKTGKLYVQETEKTLEPQDVIHYTTGGEAPQIERIKTVDGERNVVRNLRETVDRVAYRGKLHFSWKEDEAIHGLGQGEEGIYDYRHHVQYMYQHNMRIPMPFLFSSRQYGILFDCGSLMTFNDDERGSYIYMDCVDQMNYYFVAGESADDVIDGYRFLTGKAVMLPRWAYGYVQSKEAYHTGDELEEIARRYRELGVPLDCVVQDWNTWDEGKWGQKTVDKKRYGHLKENIDRMHDMHVHTMVSMWPNMNPGGENHQQFFDAGYLLNDYSTYNAFDENARDMYWQQVSEELFPAGFDSWWCDSTEPFPSPDWGGAVMREPWERYALVGGEHKKYLDAGQANEFALYHAKGVYENQKKVDKKRRVLNLTRSGYAGSQKYGTVLWSGDIYASWKTLKKQIPEGLNMAMSGMPNWTLDVGAFFVVGSAWWKRGCNNSTNPNPIWFWKGEYNDGVEDPGYRELYVRWFEYGCFLPMFRSHGTDTPREIWNFGKKGDMAYDAIEKYINLRYQLMPYVYSLAGAAYRKNRTIMRSLLFDFAEDKKAVATGNEYMYGPAFLICPVTEPMYYEADGVKLEREKTWECYLPDGAAWHEFWTGKVYAGGQTVKVDAPLDKMPIFVKTGSIVPMCPEHIDYADAVADKALKIQVYAGADGTFSLYEDAGDGYGYENGEYTEIELTWNDAAKTLTIGNREGAFDGMQASRRFTVVCGDTKKEITYDGTEVTVTLE